VERVGKGRMDVPPGSEVYLTNFSDDDKANRRYIGGISGTDVLNTVEAFHPGGRYRLGVTTGVGESPLREPSQTQTLDD